MLQKILEGIAQELNTRIEYRPYKKFGNVPYINNTALLYETINDSCRQIVVTNPEDFPNSCKKKTVMDHIAANSPNLGVIKKINWRCFNDEFFTVADIETTGLSPEKGAKIIEIGAVKVDKDGNVVGEFSSFINPHMKLPRNIKELTNITQEQVDSAPELFDVLTRFREFFRGSTVVFHNLPFDWERFLIPNLKKIGVILPPNYPCIDTLQIFREMHPEMKKHGLAELCQLYGISVENHHRAINDAQMTAKAFVKMRKEYAHKFEHLPHTQWIKQPEIKHDIKVKSVRFWGKYKVRSGDPIKERQYVNFSIDDKSASAFYEVLENSWVIQSCPVNFDVMQLQEAVLKFLKLNSIDDLKKFRN